MEQLEGRVAVITGAGSGIGEALARATARAGMKVVATSWPPKGSVSRCSAPAAW